MKRNLATWTAVVLGAIVVGSAGGCGRQSRGNADATEENRAQSSTAGSAGDAKNFGDTSRSGAHGGVTNPETPKQNTGPAANQPERQPLKSTSATSEAAPQPGQSATSGTSLVGEKGDKK